MTDTNAAPLMGADAPDMPLSALPSLPPAGAPPPPGSPPGAPPIDPSTPPPAPAASKPGPWTAMLQGALAGLAGVGNVHGRGGFGAGAGAGAASELNQRQIQTENQQRQQQINQRQQQLQYESVQAADSHIAALDQHHRADQLSDEAKIDYSAKSASYQAFLQDNFGIAPDLSFNDSHNEATAGLTTTANNNGGKIPPVATVQQPAASGQHGKIAAYSPSQERFNQNMSGYRNLINTTRAVQGMPPVDDASFNSMGFKGAKDEALKAIEFLKPTPTFSLDKNSPSYLPTVLAQKTQQLQQYQDHKDTNGKPDADPGVVKQLQGGIDYLQKSWDKTNAMEDKSAADLTTSQENAKKPFVQAEHQFQSQLQAQAKTLDRANADTTSRSLKADEMVTKEANDRDSDLKNIVDLKNNLAQIDNKNQAATSTFQVKFAEHEIVEGGVKRLNETELNALTKGLGNYGRQFDAWVSKGFKGDMPPATKDEMLTILNAEEQARNNLYNSRVGNIHQNILHQSAPTASTAAQPIYASAPGKPRMVSQDGGKTWQPTQ